MKELLALLTVAVLTIAVGAAPTFAKKPKAAKISTKGLSSAFLAFLLLGAGVAGSGTALAQIANVNLSAGEHDCVDVEFVGDICEWSLIITNLGPDTAESLVVTVFLPTGLAYGNGFTTCTPGVGVVTCPLGSIAFPGSRSTLFEFVAMANLPVGAIPITMQVLTSVTPDPDLGNNIEVDTGVALPGGDLGGLSVSAPPSEVTLTGNFSATSGGVPVIVRGREITYAKDVTGHCEPGDIKPVEVKLVVGPFSVSGGTVEIPMTNVGPGEIWEGTASISETGQAPLTFYVDCPPDTVGFPADISLSAGEDETQDAGGVIYIDPSGTILDACSNLPLDGATVTLLMEIPPGGGTFVVALETTPPITPAVNPQITLADGAYGWDVVAATYKVRAERMGFVTGESGNLTIPPPVTGLGISLDRTAGCPAATADHYLSYEVKEIKGTPKFDKVNVNLTDQFETGTFEVKKLKALYNPVKKKGERINDPDTHLVGYEIKRDKNDPKHVTETNIQVDNQFGTLRVDTEKPDRLLVPSAKSITGPVGELPPPLTVDHFKCYKIAVTKGTPEFVPVQVTLEDQFTSPRVYEVNEPTRLCNPVDKNGEGILHPESHLMCYDVRRVDIANIHVNNQFGPLQVETKMQKQVQTKTQKKELCLPSTKTRP